MGREEEEKETFWIQMDKEPRTIPEWKRVIVGGVTLGRAKKLLRGWEVGEKNEALYQNGSRSRGRKCTTTALHGGVCQHRPHINMGMR